MVLGCRVRRRHHDPQAVDQGCDHDHDPDPYREHHGHRVSITGVVIAAHVAGMFLSSPFSGWLVDRFGYLAIAAAAGVTLVAAGPLAAWAPVDSVGTLLLALVLLGLGWNLGLVSGTTVLPTLCRWLRAHAPRAWSISASHLPVLVAG
jgi:MFS family permease